MLRSIFMFLLGFLIRGMMARRAKSDPRPGVAKPWSIPPGVMAVPVSSVSMNAGAPAPAADPVSAARAYAMRIARIATDASASLASAQAKVHAGIVQNPHDEGLAEQSDLLRDTTGALAGQFMTLYAEQLAEAAIANIAGATAELDARAAEMPAATKTVQEIQPVVKAAGAVGTAIRDAR